jgi:hypothetical protein
MGGRPRSRKECICIGCGKTFTEIASRITAGRGKWCSRECRYAHERTHVNRICEVCGKHFDIVLSVVLKGKAKYCSQACMGIAARRNTTFTCLTCGKEVERRLSTGGEYCSRQCAAAHRNSRETLICAYCKSSFEVHKSTASWRKYCSQKCYAFAHRGVNHELWRGGSRKDRGLNWPTQRDLAYKRDGGICQICNQKPKKGRKNSVHHIRKYREFNGDYVTANDLSNLITLCQHCHPKAERGKIAVPKRLL